jgi:DNA-binding NarL/FixJ family response regulator
LSEPNRFPSYRDHFSTARGVQRLAKAERERRVVEGLTCGVAMAEIARREGITER